MILSGHSMMKFVATVAAILTVTTSIPRAQCVCPDGSVKDLYLGLMKPACCHAAWQFHTSSSPTANQFSCCHSGHEHGPDGVRVGAPCGCKTGLAFDSLSYSFEDNNESKHAISDATALHQSPISAGHEAGPALAWVVPPFLLPPQDRVVQFCHFTC